MSLIESEFAAVDVSVDSAGNSPRLKLEDLKSGHAGYLDALELETLAWLPEGGLHRLLDPSEVRWRDVPRIDELVNALYAALGTGDKNALLELLAEDFEAEFAAGMPLEIPAPIRGPQAMIDTWWAIGSMYKIRPEPSEWIACAGGRLLVIGTYTGKARATGRELQARFVHVLSARDAHLTRLWHLTDTAAWTEALASH